MAETGDRMLDGAWVPLRFHLETLAAEDVLALGFPVGGSRIMITILCRRVEAG